MSATTSDFLYRAQMDQVLKNVAIAGYASVWISLHTGGGPDLSNPIGSLEVSTSATNYGRVEVAVPGWSNDSGLVYDNDADIQFLVPSATWGTITYVGIYSAQTGADILFSAALTTSKVVNNGDGAPKILAGQLRIDRASC